MAKDLAIVLADGGVNAAVAAALAAQKYRTVLLFAEAGPPPGSRWRAAYDQQVAHFKPYREHTLPMPFLAPLAAGPAAAPGATDARPPAGLGGKLVELLPLVAAAARYAAHYAAVSIYLGLRAGGGADELAQATEYVQVWEELFQLPCGLPDLSLAAPLLELEPWQVIDLGFQAGAPFDRTWSCLEDGNEPCWACRGCRAREAAFQQAGKPDPLRGARR